MPSLLQSNSYDSGSAAPAGSVAVTVIVAEPPSSIGPSFVTETIVGAALFTVTEPVYSLSPPSNAYWKPADVSVEDGSVVPVSESWKLWPSFTGPPAEKVALGATFATLSAAFEADDEAPWLSVTVSETVKLPLSVQVIVGFCAVAELKEHGAPALTLHA